MLIESSPTNLDPRVGVDAPSERIDDLIFDDLLSRGDHLDVAPGLAERWEIPDPLTFTNDGKLLFTHLISDITMLMKPSPWTVKKTEP